MTLEPSAENLNFLDSLQGEWQYQCTVSSPTKFPDNNSHNCHGGTCWLKIIRKPLITEIQVRGRREWNGDEGISLSQRKKGDKTKLPVATTWESVRGALISDFELMYQYRVGTEGISGITFIKFDADTDSLSKGLFKGEFYYLPEAELKPLGKKGSKRDLVNPPPSDLIFASKRQLKWLRVHGELELIKIPSADGLTDK